MRLGAVFTRHHAVKVSRRLPVAVALLVLAGSAGYRWTNAPVGRHPQVAARSVSPATTATRPAAPPTSAQATTTVHPQTGDTLSRQVRAGGGTARSYVESMPTNCAVAPQARYAVKHNPAAYYTGGDARHACVADDVPMGTTTAGALASDLGGDLP